MSAFGVSPLGTSLGPFGGPGLITVLGVLPLSTTSCVVVFDREPRYLDSAAIDSGTNPANYELTSVDPTIYPPLASQPTVPAGAAVPTRQPYIGLAERDRTDRTQIVLTTDARMDPGVTQVVHVSAAIRGRGGETFAGPQDWAFRSPGLAPAPASPAADVQDRYRDFAWDLTGGDEAWRFDSTGDIAIADGRASLRSRIYRRMLTQPGAFVFLPGYGAGIAAKALARPAERQALANTIAAQAQLEPEVVQATADVSFETTDRGGLVRVTVHMRLADGSLTQASYTQQA